MSSKCSLVVKLPIVVSVRVEASCVVVVVSSGCVVSEWLLRVVVESPLLLCELLWERDELCAEVRVDDRVLDRVEL